MPAETFVQIWKFIARPNLCGTPACVKPPPRCAQAGQCGWDSKRKNKEKLK